MGISELSVGNNYETSFEKPLVKNIWRIVRSFFQNLKEKTSFFRFSEYEASINKYLRDSIFFTKSEVSKGSQTLAKFENSYDRLLKYLFSLFFLCFDKLGLKRFFTVWNPYEPLRLLWDMLLFMMIMMEFYYIPIELAFGVYISHMNWIIIFILITNALISLNTAYYFRGSLVTTRLYILKNYMKKYLINDISTVLVFIVVSSVEDSEVLPFFQLVFYLNAKRFFNIHNILDEKFKLYYRFHGFLEILELIFFSLFIIHIFACGFYWISIQSIDDYPKTWISVEEINTNNWQEGYTYAFYWATITIMTVGYGDVVPQNTIERIYVIFTAIMGCGVFAFNVSMIGRICEKMSKDDEEFK